MVLEVISEVMDVLYTRIIEPTAGDFRQTLSVERIISIFVEVMPLLCSSWD